MPPNMLGLCLTSAFATIPFLATPVLGQMITVESCGMEISMDAPASAIVTLDQSSTETLLGLGAAPKMAGTAYLKTEIAPQYREAWESVPMLTKAQPTAEVVRAAEPDLLVAYSGYFYSAQGVGTREELQDLGVGTYISAVSCPPADEPELTSFDLLARDYINLGRLSGQEAQAEAVIADQNAAIAAAKDLRLTREDPIRVMWLYSVFEGTPYVAGGPSIPGRDQ